MFLWPITWEVIMRKFNVSAFGKAGVGAFDVDRVAEPTLGNMIWDVTSTGNVAEDAGYLTYVVSRSGDVSAAATINIATANGTAIVGLDYTALSQTLSFAGGESSKIVKVAILNDTLAESSETVKLVLVNPSKGTISHAEAVAVIHGNDSVFAGAKWSVASADADVDESAGYISFVVSREGNTNHAATIKVATSDGTAKAGEDYVALAQTVKFAPGETSKVIKVAIVDDALIESDEAVNLIISQPDKGKVVKNKATVTIYDNDQNHMPEIISADSATVAENTTGMVYQATATDLDGDNITYSLTGADAEWFNIDINTGAVSFKNTPDYEAVHPSESVVLEDGRITMQPADFFFRDNTYDINVIATDGKLTVQKTVTVTVTNVNEAPIIVSTDSAMVAENTAGLVYQVGVRDPDLNPMQRIDSSTYTYSLTGADADWFSIDMQGMVTFKNTPDYEAHRAPANGSNYISNYPFIDNTYDINVIVSDGSLSTEKAVQITVTDVNDANVVLLGEPIYGTENNDIFVGTSGIDYINGFAGDDVFIESLARDILTGGAGQDTFNFKLGWVQGEDGAIYAGLDSNSIDTITDFVSGVDTIGFTGGFILQGSSSLRIDDDLLVQGPGAVALETNDWFIFDSNNGALYFDADGNGAGAAEQFATLYGVMSLAASDIEIYASDVIL
jgi:Ca2+-binding RTX toxin-like protein